MKKGGQVWIETVIYTLIALVMITAVLAFAKPKLEEMQDQALIEQSIGILQDIDTLVLSVVQGGQGNKRTLDIGIKKGNLEIKANEDTIMFTLEGRKQYSEPGLLIEDGNLFIQTTEKGKRNEVSIWRNYSGIYDLTYYGDQTSKQLSKSSQSYQIIIANTGQVEEVDVVNFEVN
jgi:hypothetical protein